MVNGGDRCATPWTNMHNNACNMILMIHGTAVVPHHVPAYIMCRCGTSTFLYLLYLPVNSACTVVCGAGVISHLYIFDHLIQIN